MYLTQTKKAMIKLDFRSRYSVDFVEGRSRSRVLVLIKGVIPRR